MLETITIAEALTALAVIAAAVAVIVRALKPWNDTQTRIRKLEDAQVEICESIRDLREGNKRQNTLMLQLATHTLDGNHVEKLKEARDSMQQFLIERG